MHALRKWFLPGCSIGRGALLLAAGAFALGGAGQAAVAATAPVFVPVSGERPAARQVSPTPPRGALRVFFIDVEGGQATLFVTPEGHTLLIDTGWNDHEARDANRILAAMTMAHVARLDAVLITHYHLDHVGGAAQLAARVPIGMFLDHGPNREHADPVTETARTAYEQLIASGRYGHAVLHVGDALPVAGFTGTVVSADGQVAEKPLPGAGMANPYCADAGQAQPDATENSRSLGIVLRWGRARVLDLGDLTRDKEKELMCPVNRLGRVDLLVVSHHGWYQSSSHALVDAVAARVAVMDNGAVKGGSASVLATFRQSPARTALWQLHYAQAADSEQAAATARAWSGADAAGKAQTDLNTIAGQIANLAGSAQGQDAGYVLEAMVSPDGTIAVWNSRTLQVTHYAAGAPRR